MCRLSVLVARSPVTSPHSVSSTGCVGRSSATSIMHMVIITASILLANFTGSATDYVSHTCLPLALGACLDVTSSPPPASADDTRCYVVFSSMCFLVFYIFRYVHQACCSFWCFSCHVSPPYLSDSLFLVLVLSIGFPWPLSALSIYAYSLAFKLLWPPVFSGYDFVGNASFS